MATAAFRSTTRRTSIGDSSTSSSTTTNHRRSRSVSRFSHRLPVDEEPEPEPPSVTRRGKFVNTVRGSGVPEISLDDLAIEMFSSSDFGERGRKSKTTTSEEVSSSVNDTAAFRRRGRSVSRRGSRVGELRDLSVDNRNSNNKINNERNNNNNNNRSNNLGVSDASSRRRRSLSVNPRRISDSENELLQNNRYRANYRDRSVSNKEKPLVQKPTAANQQRGLRRCSSQKDFMRSLDGYSSYSSTLTDDEGIDVRYRASGVGKGPNHFGHDQNGRWYEAMQKESTHTGKDVRLELGQDRAENSGGLQSIDSDILKSVSTMRRSCKTKLEQSEKRKQELLAEIMLEEERGKELKRVVGNLHSTPKATAAVRRPMRGRKRSNDRNRMSKQLVEDADKIIEDFISSVEETDISSFDGERSDTSSIIGGTIKPMMQYGDTANFRSPLRSDLLPGEMDGVVLPWLKWETSNDGNPLLCSDIKQHPDTPKTVLQDAMEEVNAGPEQDQSVNSKSSRGSWSPGVVHSFSLDKRDTSGAGEVDSCKSQLLSLIPRRVRVDIDDYLKPPSNEDFVSERWRQRESINSGGLLICHSSSIGKFFL